MTTASKFKIELGARVKDRVTGYTGIVTCRSEWLYGCIRYSVQSQELRDGKPIESIGTDEDQLEVLEDPKPQKKTTRGGPTPAASRAPDPKR